MDLQKSKTNSTESILMNPDQTLEDAEPLENVLKEPLLTSRVYEWIFH